MPSSFGTIRQTIGVLSLPARKGQEMRAAFALKRELKKMGIAPDDFLSWGAESVDGWRESGVASQTLKAVCRAVIRASGGDLAGEKLAEKYFDVHKRLQSEQLFSHSSSTALLSHAFLIYDLAVRDRMSCAQIARMLNSRDSREIFSRHSVSIVARSLNAIPAVSCEKISHIYARDKKLELGFFADADLIESASRVSEIASSLEFPSKLDELLLCLSKIERDRIIYIPYIQILHYQCCLAEIYDHPLTELYEFTPRGQAALWLFNSYPSVLSPSGNPFLNNAKAVESIDGAWVRSKEKERRGAAALFAILSGLEQMSFLARRELAHAIRMWIHRVLRLATVPGTTVCMSISDDIVKSVIDRLCVENTGTSGVIEQRCIDASASERHPESDGWRSRGLGDAVNVTNISQRKLGDCDFQHTEKRIIFAYEAHGGSLTRFYVTDHLRTLRKSIRLRVMELSGVADLDDWAVNLIYVCHNIRLAKNFCETIEGVKVTISAVTFGEFFAEKKPSVETFKKYVIDAVNHRRTPDEVRRTLADMMT